MPRYMGSNQREGLRAFLIDDLGAQFDQHFGNVDLDRADFIAGAAQR